MIDKSFKPKYFHIQWHITEKCNLDCTHCYKDPNLSNKEVSFSDIKNILKRYSEQLKKWKLEKGTISFMGGEPFVREDFLDILEETSKYHLPIDCSFSSNGTLINKKIAKKIKKLGVKYLQISIEGGEKINDEIRGKNVFKQAIEAIKILKKENLEVSISTTISKLNINEVPHIISLAKKLKVNSIGFRRIVPLGNSKNAKKFLLSPNETKKFYLYLLKKEKENLRPLTEACEMGIVAQEEKFNRGCPAGYTTFVIMPEGTVFPCRRMPICSGNILKQSFEEIYYNSTIFKKLRNIKNNNEICGKCPHFLECRGGARCISYAYYKNPFNPDPQCWRCFSKLPHSNLNVPKIEKIEKENYSKWTIKI